jgi:hypothetical protein
MFISDFCLSLRLSLLILEWHHLFAASSTTKIKRSALHQPQMYLPYPLRLLADSIGTQSASNRASKHVIIADEIALDILLGLYVFIAFLAVRAWLMFNDDEKAKGFFPPGLKNASPS